MDYKHNLFKLFICHVLLIGPIATAMDSGSDASQVFQSSAASLTSIAFKFLDPIVSHTGRDIDQLASILDGIKLESESKNKFGGKAFYVAENGFSIHEVMEGKFTIAFNLSRKTNIQEFIKTGWPGADYASLVRNQGFDAILYRGTVAKNCGKFIYNLAIINNPENLTPIGIYPVPEGERFSAISTPTIRTIQVAGIIGNIYSIYHAGYEIIYSDHPALEAGHQTALFTAAIRGGALGAAQAIRPCAALGFAFPVAAPYTVPICIATGSIAGGIAATTVTEIGLHGGAQIVTASLAATEKYAG